MALNIEDQETEKLAAEVAELTGESENDAVREALKERRDRLTLEKGERPRKKKRDTLLFTGKDFAQTDLVSALD